MATAVPSAIPGYEAYLLEEARRRRMLPQAMQQLTAPVTPPVTYDYSDLNSILPSALSRQMNPDFAAPDTTAAAPEMPVMPAVAPVEAPQTRALPQAVEAAQSTLTQNVQPGDAVGGYRQKAAEFSRKAAEAMGQEPDMTAAQNYMRQRAEQGDMAMLNALAAQFAGERFEPIQAKYLKRAAAAREPMKVGRGMVTPDGQFIRDEGAAQDQRVQLLLQQAKAYEQMALTAETERERAAARAAQNEVVNALRLMQAETGRMNAQTQQLLAGSGMLGSGNAQQIGSGLNNEPVMRSPNGQLFTYDNTGRAIPYQGPVNPKASTSQPSEDERKAAGWFAQAGNAIANMETIMRETPGAANAKVGERVAGMVPMIGQDIANVMRPESRQRFLQAAESMSEALLRAATGAAITRQEQEQKLRELIPQIGDQPGTVKQKLDSYKVYMDSLKARAGRALPGNAPAAAAPAGNVVDFNSLPK